jgi:hypothetical protein
MKAPERVAKKAKLIKCVLYMRCPDCQDTLDQLDELRKHKKYTLGCKFGVFRGDTWEEIDRQYRAAEEGELA